MFIMKQELETTNRQKKDLPKQIQCLIFTVQFTKLGFTVIYLPEGHE